MSGNEMLYRRVNCVLHIIAPSFCFPQQIMGGEKVKLGINELQQHNVKLVYNVKGSYSRAPKISNDFTVAPRRPLCRHPMSLRLAIAAPIQPQYTIDGHHDVTARRLCLSVLDN
jgi:hypothetical protein